MFVAVLMLMTLESFSLCSSLYDSSSTFEEFSQSSELMNNNIIEYGYCLTWDSTIDKPVISPCPYNCKSEYISSDMLNANLSYFFCSRFKRQGTNCKDCINGYGPSPFLNGANIPCADCSHNKHMWLLYLVLQLFMITLLYFIFVACEFRGTSSPTNALAYFYQIIVNEIITLGSDMLPQMNCILNGGLLKTGLLFYGLWNLDFFRSFVPPLCVSPSLSNANALLFDYIIAFYPVFLTVLSYFVIRLHDNGTQTILFISRPIKTVFSKIKKDWNPKQSILNTFATFMLLSYSKILYTACTFLYPTKVYDYYDNKPTENSLVMFYDASLTYFGRCHLPYVIFSLLVIVLFVLVPPLILLFYPTKCFKRCLAVCKFRRWHSLSIIMDVFQGWYKDGTGNTHDYRGLSALYMFLRIGFAIELILIPLNFKNNLIPLAWVATAIVHISLGCLHLVLRPYKKNWMNVVDGLVLVTLGMLGFTVVANEFIIASIVSTLPMLTALLYFVAKCLKKIHLFDSISFILKKLKQSVMTLGDTEMNNSGAHDFSYSEERNFNVLSSVAEERHFKAGNIYGTF